MAGSEEGMEKYENRGTEGREMRKIYLENVKSNRILFC